jgi:hypothetical protein
VNNFDQNNNYAEDRLTHDAAGNVQANLTVAELTCEGFVMRFEGSEIVNKPVKIGITTPPPSSTCWSIPTTSCQDSNVSRMHAAADRALSVCLGIPVLLFLVLSLAACGQSDTPTRTSSSSSDVDRHARTIAKRLVRLVRDEDVRVAAHEIESIPEAIKPKVVEQVQSLLTEEESRSVWHFFSYDYPWAKPEVTHTVFRKGKTEVIVAMGMTIRGDSSEVQWETAIPIIAGRWNDLDLKGQRAVLALMGINHQDGLHTEPSHQNREHLLEILGSSLGSKDRILSTQAVLMLYQYFGIITETERDVLLADADSHRWERLLKLADQISESRDMLAQTYRPRENGQDKLYEPDISEGDMPFNVGMEIWSDVGPGLPDHDNRDMTDGEAE